MPMVVAVGRAMCLQYVRLETDYSEGSSGSQQQQSFLKAIFTIHAGRYSVLLLTHISFQCTAKCQGAKVAFGVF